METNNIKYKEISDLETIPDFLNWDKENSWQRLAEKRKSQRRYKIFRFTAAASIVGIIFSISILLFNEKSKPDYTENSITEYQNRLKLNEMEQKLSGNYFPETYCFVCDGFLPQKQKIKNNSFIFLTN